MGEEYVIKLKEGAVPYALHSTLPEMCHFPKCVISSYEERSKKSYVEWRKWV